MKKVAVLIDGEFFSRAIKKGLAFTGRPNAKLIHKNAVGLLATDEEALRIFFYDSRPFDGQNEHPLTGVKIDYSKSTVAQARSGFLAELGQMDLIALRCGITKPRGWQLTRDYLHRLKTGPVAPPLENDYE